MLYLLIISLVLNAVLVISALILITHHIYYSEYIQRRRNSKTFSRETQIFLDKLNREREMEGQK